MHEANSEESESIKINKRNVVVGTEISVVGQPGRFSVLWFTETKHGNINVTCWGGRIGHEKFRTFAIEKVRKVHNKPKMRKGTE